MRRIAAAIFALAVWLPSCPASAQPVLSLSGLEQLRDRLATEAPAGSSAYVDQDGRRVVLRVPGKRTARVSTAIGVHGRQVHVEENSAPAVLTSTIVGGSPIDAGFSTSAKDRCNVGFLAQAYGERWLMTAGHCTNRPPNTPTEYWYGEGGAAVSGIVGIGTARAPLLARDFGTILISRITPHTYGPYVIHNGQHKRITRAFAPYRKRTGPQPVICKTGRVTGTTCGEYLRSNVTVTFHTGEVISGLYETNLCGLEGDSGAPLYATEASIVPEGDTIRLHYDGHGVMVGGNNVCTSAEGRTWFYPLTDALAHYGYTLVG